MYSQVVKNIEEYVQSGLPTRVKFVYFQATNLKQPLVRTELRKRTLESNQTYYLCHGSSTNFTYAYQENNLKFLLHSNQGPNAAPSEKSAYLAHVNSIPVTLLPYNGDESKESVHAGHHIDFGLVNQRNGDMLFKVHYTSYENWLEPVVTRDSLPCNYMMSSIKDTDYLTSLEAFKQVGCIERLPDKTIVHNGTTCGKFQHHADIVYALSCAAVGYKQQEKLQVKIGGKMRKCYRGKRKGLYVKRKGKRVYLKSGGAISILDDENFVNFLYERIFQHIVRALGSNLVSITLLYDEGNELTPIENDEMTVIYDLTDDRTSFYHVDMAIIKTVFDTRTLHTRTDKAEQVDAMKDHMIHTLLKSEKVLV